MDSVGLNEINSECSSKELNVERMVRSMKSVARLFGLWHLGELLRLTGLPLYGMVSSPWSGCVT